MAQKVQNVYVDQGSGPLPFPIRVPTLPPSAIIFWGFFLFFTYEFFLISRLLASTYVTVAPRF